MLILFNKQNDSLISSIERIKIHIILWGFEWLDSHVNSNSFLCLNNSFLFDLIIMWITIEEERITQLWLLIINTLYSLLSFLILKNLNTSWFYSLFLFLCLSCYNYSSSQFLFSMKVRVFNPLSSIDSLKEQDHHIVSFQDHFLLSNVLLILWRNQRHWSRGQMWNQESESSMGVHKQF